jgi:hypothetical protein
MTQASMTVLAQMPLSHDLASLGLARPREKPL